MGGPLIDPTFVPASSGAFANEAVAEIKGWIRRRLAERTARGELEAAF
jgi:hypothetical protein